MSSHARWWPGWMLVADWTGSWWGGQTGVSPEDGEHCDSDIAAHNSIMTICNTRLWCNPPNSKQFKLSTSHHIAIGLLILRNGKKMYPTMVPTPTEDKK